EGQGAFFRLVVTAAGGAAVNRRVVHGDGLIACLGQGDLELGLNGAGVAFRHRRRVRDADQGRARGDGCQQVGAALAVGRDGTVVVDGRCGFERHVGAVQQLGLEVHHAVRRVPEESVGGVVVLLVVAAGVRVVHVNRLYAVAVADNLAGVVDAEGVTT